MALSPRLLLLWMKTGSMPCGELVIKYIFFLGLLYWHNYESHVHSAAWRSAFTWPAMPHTQCCVCWGWRWSDPDHNTAWLVRLLWRIDHQRCFEQRNSSSLYPLGKPTLHSLMPPNSAAGYPLYEAATYAPNQLSCSVLASAEIEISCSCSPACLCGLVIHKACSSVSF